MDPPGPLHSSFTAVPHGPRHMQLVWSLAIRVFSVIPLERLARESNRLFSSQSHNVTTGPLGLR